MKAFFLIVFSILFISFNSQADDYVISSLMGPGDLEIEFEHDKDTTSFYLIENSERVLIKSFESKGHILENLRNTAKWNLKDHKLTCAVVDGHHELNDALIRGLEGGVFFLFPIPLAANAVYSLAYIPTVIIDMFYAGNRAYRKFKRFIKGKYPVTTSQKVFDMIVESIRNTNQNDSGHIYPGQAYSLSFVGPGYCN